MTSPYFRLALLDTIENSLNAVFVDKSMYTVSEVFSQTYYERRRLASETAFSYNITIESVVASMALHEMNEAILSGAYQERMTYWYHDIYIYGQFAITETGTPGTFSNPSSNSGKGKGSSTFFQELGEYSDFLNASDGIVHNCCML